MKQTLHTILIQVIFFSSVLNSQSGICQSALKKVVECNIDIHLEVEPDKSVVGEQLFASSRSVNNLCVNFLVANDAQLTVNSAAMTSIINGINSWLSTTHNPLPGPDYQVTSWQRSVMAATYQPTVGSPVSLTIAGNANGGLLVSSIQEWTSDLGLTGIFIAIAPNSSAYNPGTASWAPQINQIGDPTNPAVAVIRASSNTIINFNSLVFVHEVFGHLQGLAFSSDTASHSTQSCNGSTDFINAAPTNTQICSEATAQIALATDNGGTVCATVLPLRLLSFRGETQKNKSALNWSTTNEENFSHFIIEKSSSGFEWETIAKVKGKGRNNTPSLYSFLDNSKQNSINYYRLKMIDNDNSSMTSPIISINSETNKNITISPTLISDYLNIHTNETTEKLSINIIDVTGKTVFSKAVQNMESDYRLDLSTLISGTYFISVFDGVQTEVSKVVKL